MNSEPKAASSSQPTVVPDTELLDHVKSGDERALATLYDRYSRLVYSVAVRVLRQPASAEDVLHEMFMQIWRNPSGFRTSPGNLGASLPILSRNRSVDVLRRKRSFASVEQIFTPVPLDITNAASHEALWERTQATVQQLPREQRKSLDMAYFDGLPSSEIAELTGDSSSTVKTRIRAALLGLRNANQEVSEQSFKARVEGAGHPPAEELVLYAMQLVPAQQVASMVVHLDSCPACTEELARIYGDLALYSLSVDIQAPAAGARQTILDQVSREPRRPRSQAAPKPKLVLKPDTEAGIAAHDRSRDAQVTARAGLTRRRDAMFWTGWVMAALCAMATTFLAGNRMALRETIETQSQQLQRLNAEAAASHRLLDALTDPRAIRVTLTGKNAPRFGPTGEVTYNSEKGTLVFLASELDPLQRLKTYELWLIPRSGSAIPAGTFHPDDYGNGSIILPDLPKGIAAKSFSVTIEKEGGSVTPTLPPMMSGSKPAPASAADFQ